MRNKVNTELRNAKKDYYSSKIASQKQNPKQAWETINNLLGRLCKQTVVNQLSALKSWLQLILAKYDINGNYSSYIKATSTKLAIIIVRPSVNKLQHFVAMETVM